MPGAANECNTNSCRPAGRRTPDLPIGSPHGRHPFSALPRTIMGAYLRRESGAFPHHVGSLDAEGRLIPDIEADPLAAQYIPRRGKQEERVTFFTYSTRQTLLASLLQGTREQDSMQAIDLGAPLITQRNGSKATLASVARARQRSKSLIRACSDTNVSLCRATGDFFREWGLPGSRFVGPEELPMEEYR